MKEYWEILRELREDNDKSQTEIADIRLVNTISDRLLSSEFQGR